MPPKKAAKAEVTIDPKIARKKDAKVEAKKDDKKKETKKRYSMKVVTEVGSMEHIEWGWISYERRRNRKKLYQLWDGIVAGLSLIQFTITAYFAAFDPYNSQVLGFLYVLDFADLLDIWMKVVKYFKTDRRNVELRKGNSDLERYVFSWFILDIIGLLPTDLAIQGAGKTQQMPTLAYYRCNRLCVGYKVFKYLSSLEAEVGAAFIMIRAVYFGVLSWILMHIMACIWYLIPCSTWSEVRDGVNICWTPSWISRVPPAISGFGKRGNLYSSFLDHGIGGEELVRINASVGQRYYHALHWSITTITTVGLGDIFAVTQPEMLFAIVAQFFTLIMLFGMFQGSVASMLSNLDQIMFRYKNRISAIVQYLRDQNQSTELVRNVINFYKYLWKRSKGIDSNAVYNELPFALRSDIGLEICHQIIQKSPLLQETGPGFLRMLALKFRPFLALPEQTVMEKGEVSDLMVYIQHGELEVLSDDETEVPVLLLKEEKLFGEVNLITKVPRKFSVRSIAHCDLIVLKTEDLMDCLQAFPDVADELRVRAEERTGGIQLQKLDVNGVAIDNVDALRRRKQQKELANKMEDLKAEMGINLRPLMTALNIDRPQETLKVSESMELFKIRDPMDEMVEYNMGSFTRRVASRSRRLKQFLIDLSIDPDGMFYYIWERLVVAAVIVTFYLNTYVGFFMSYENIMADPAGTGYVILVFSYLMDVFFMFDFGFKFVMQIITANGKIVSHKQMALAYVKSWGCYTDFFAILPIEIFALVALNDAKAQYSTWTLLGFLKLNRALRVLNMPRFFDKLSADLDTSIMQVRIVKFITYIGMATQISAVMLFLTACDPMKCIYDMKISWTAPPPVSITPASAPDYKLTSSIYYGVTLSSGTGYGDIFPRTTGEQFVADMVMLMGMLMYGYCLASVTATLINTDAPRMEFQDRLFAMVAFLDNNKVSPNHIRRAADSLALLWNVSNGEEIPGIKSMMADMPPVLMEDIQVDDLIHLVSSVPLFRGIEDRVLRLFAPSVRRYLLTPNEFAIQSGDLIEELFVVRRGVCNMYHPDQANVVTCVLYPGMYFGEIGFLFNRHELATVKAVTFCEILAISRPTFDYIVQDIEWLQLQMDQISESRKFYEDLINAAKEAKPYVKATKHSSPTRATDTSKRGVHFKEDFQVIKSSIFGKYLYHLLMQQTIHMDGRFLHAWEMIRSAAAGALFCMILVQAGFQLDSFYFFGVLYLFDIYAFADIYLKLHVQYANDMHMIVAHPYKTAMRYLRTSFFIDFIAVFPFEIFLMCAPVAFSQDELLHWAMYLRMNRLLQIYRIPMLFGYLQGDIQNVLPGLKWLKYFVYFVLFNFFVLALPFIIECPPEPCALSNTGCYFKPPLPPPSDLNIALDVSDYTHQSDVEFNHFQNSESVRRNTPQRIPRGIQEYIPPITDSSGKVNLDNSLQCLMFSYLQNELLKGNTSLTDLIIPSWYWAVNTVTGTGFGDIFSRNQIEQLVMAIAMITGNLFCSYIVGSIAAEQTNKGIKRAKFVNKLTAVKQYMHHERIPPFLELRILRYYNLFWLRTKGDNPAGMISGLPPSLTGEIAVQLYKKVIDQIGVFKSTSPSFKKMLASVIKPLFIMEGEFVIRAGDIGTELYFLYRGSVEIQQRGEAVPAVLRAGRMLGELAFMTGQKAKSNIRARENTDVFYVTHDDFEMIFDHFPEVREDLLAEANESLNRERDNKKQPEQTAGNPTTSQNEYGGSQGESNIGDAAAKLWDATIRSDSAFSFYFGCWMAYVRALSSMLILYHCGFGDLRIGLLVFEYILEVFIIFDFFVQRRTGFIDEYGNMILEKQLILERFWKHKLGFWLFIVSILPYELGALAVPKAKALFKPWVFAFLRIFRVVPRLIRLYKFFQVWLMELNINILFVRLTYSVTRLFLCSHFFTVVAFIIAAPMGIINEKTWISRTMLRFPPRQPSEYYITSLYWIANTITSTGYGDIVADSDSGRIFSSFVQIIGKAVYALIIGDIVSTVANRDIWRRSFENRYNAMKGWLFDQRVKQNTMERVRSYCNYLWNTNRGIIDIHTMLDDVPYSMQAEIAFAVHSREIRDIPIFNNASDALIRVLSTCLKQIQFVPGDYLIAQGDYVREVYFLHRGEAVEVESGVEIGVIRHGKHINWQCLLIDWPASRTVRATDNCEVYVLSQEDFDRVKANYLSELGEICASTAQKLTDFLLEPQVQEPPEDPGSEGETDEEE